MTYVSPSDRPAIAIVGSGPSALYTLKTIVNELVSGDIVLFEAGDRPGVGTPYDERYNPPEMLANIASIELPPLHETLLEWLSGLDLATRTSLGVSTDQLHERHFFPRMVLGAYFTAGLAWLVDRARAKGLDLDVRTRRPVIDLVASGGSVEVLSCEGSALSSERFDFVVLATGHQAPRRSGCESVMADPYRNVHVTADARRLGILGSSLSAIDVAVSHALRFGEFVDAGGRIEYQASSDHAGRSITMMSRSGILPEADFFCPIPYVPLEIFTPAAVSQATQQPEGALDRLFGLFRTQLVGSDPDYAVGIDLASATADDFADRYFAARKTADPFAWADENLAEVRCNAAARATVAWRYAILRMHEPFGAALHAMDERDMARFNAGLKGVFVDNYAAVPPLSIERILALHRAGVLSLLRLGEDYTVEFGEDGQWRVANDENLWTFDQMVDARGQSALGQEDFPFPTLRMQVRANALLGGADDAAIPLAKANAIADGSDLLARIYCLSLPFVMQRNPFVQGLTAASEMGKAAATAIVAATLDGAENGESRADIARLIGEIERTGTVLCGTGEGLVPIAVPRAAFV